MNDIAVIFMSELLMLSKREGVLVYEIVNKSDRPLQRINLKKISVGGLGLSIVDSDVISELGPGETGHLEARVTMPGNVPFEFVSGFATGNAESVFDSVSPMTKADFDKLPEWS